jgi:hypothetical protein
VAELIRVADGLTPQEDYSFLPADVTVWAGYLGKPSVGEWTAAQIQHAREQVGAWWAIWTLGSGGAVTAGDATAAAAAMLAKLAAVHYPKSDPVFLDVEYGRWADNPAVTEHSAALWCQTMRSSGYPRAHWYGPWDSDAGWRARWTGTMPTELPPGVVGIQYDHGLSGDRYDISVFDAALLEVDDLPTAPEIAKAMWTYPETGTVHDSEPTQPIGQFVANVNGRLVDIATLQAETNSLLGEVVAKLDALTPPPAP